MYIVRNRNLFFALTGIVLFLSILSIGVFGLEGGVDLRGGALLEVSYEEARPGLSEIQSRVTNIPVGEIRVQPTGEAGYIIRTRDLNDAEREALLHALSSFGSEAHLERYTSIGPTIGAELRTKGIIAIILVSLAIIAYVAFVFRHVSKPVPSWKYGAVTILTLFHDIVVPTGLFALLGALRGAEVDSLFIVAVLTILGISINDTIVTFDRIRENLRWNNEHKVKEPYETVVGKSMDQTTTRSFNTSFTVVLALLALLFFGPDSMQNFALTLTVGMIAGTYSSLFLAAPLLVVLEKLQRKS